MPRPGELHGFVAANFARVLGNYAYQKRRGYVCGNDTGVLWERDPDTVRGPDVIYYAEKRKARDLSPKYSEQVPNLIVEVLSPNDRMSKVNERLTQFLAWGVQLVWLADPEDSTITVYRSDAAPKVYKADQELSGEDVLPDLSFRVADLFLAPGEEDSPK